jgi:hypothetical protein
MHTVILLYNLIIFFAFSFPPEAGSFSSLARDAGDRKEDAKYAGKQVVTGETSLLIGDYSPLIIKPFLCPTN